MSSKVTGSILDVSLFKRLLRYVKPYRFTFLFVLIAAILLSVFSTLNPYLLKITVDDYITLKDYDGMLVFIGIMAAVLFLEVFFQFSFIYYANWLGQRVVYDLRKDLFRRMIGFRKTFFDLHALRVCKFCINWDSNWWHWRVGSQSTQGALKIWVSSGIGRYIGFAIVGNVGWCFIGLMVENLLKNYS